MMMTVKNWTLLCSYAIVVLRYMTLIQQITTFYEDNFPEVMKNILVIKGVFLIFLKLLFSAIVINISINYLIGQYKNNVP